MPLGNFMRFFVASLIFIISATTSPAATVTGDVRQVSIAAADAHYAQFIPARPQTAGGIVYLGAPVTIELTNGILATRLIGAVYTLKFLPVGGTITNLTVPVDDGTYNIASLITNLPTYSYTNPALSRITAHVIPGTNIVAWTNNAGTAAESLTINATSSGGGSMDYTVTNSLASTNYVVAATNALNTSLRAALAQTNAVALTNGSNAFYWDASGGTWYSPNPVTFADLGGEGSGLTNLNADYITLGTLAEARIAASIARDTEVQDATNSLNTTLRAALAQTNVYNGIAFTNIAASNIVSGGQLGMGVVAAGISNIAGPFLTTNTFSRYYSWNGGALTNVTASSLTNGVVSGMLVYSGTTNYGATTWTNTATGASITMTNGRTTNSGYILSASYTPIGLDPAIQYFGLSGGQPAVINGSGFIHNFGQGNFIISNPNDANTYFRLQRGSAYWLEIINEGILDNSTELVQIGEADSATPTRTNALIHTGDGSGTDKPGQSLTLSGGRGTGAGAPGTLYLASAGTRSSGSTLQVFTNQVALSPDGTLSLSNRLVASGTITSTNGYWIGTNNAPPTASQSPGQAFVWNSNATVYLLTTTPGATAWAATNKLGGP
jgi:hypothetical protein